MCYSCYNKMKKAKVLSDEFSNKEEKFLGEKEKASTADITALYAVNIVQIKYKETWPPKESFKCIRKCFHQIV